MPPPSDRSRTLVVATTALAALITLVALLAPLANAQNEGEACGPTYDTGDDWKWIAVPSSRLTASSGDAASTGANGCATSDRGPYAHVAARLPQGSYSIFAVAFEASGGTGGNLTMLVGNANMTAVVDDLRSGGAGAAVFQHFTRCQQRRNFALTKRRQILNCNPEVDVWGHWVVLLAESLTVCNVMICAQQAHFTRDGTPLTRAAALMLPGVNATDTSPGSSSLVTDMETCAGYTTQNWAKCRRGRQCVRTYKPGDDVCRCFQCSAFTEGRQCEQADTIIGYYACCFTCPYQPVCGVCITPCNPVFQRIEVTPGVLPTKPSDVSALSYSYSSTTQAINMGTNPQTITVSFSIAQQLTATMSYAEAFQFTEKATLKIGIPYIKDSTLEFQGQQTFTTTTTNTAQTTTTYTTALQQQIPPLTIQEVKASAKADTITTRVPVTVKTFYTCDKVDIKETFAIIKTEGTLSATAAQLNITYGPQFPIEQPIVYPQATATCTSNPVCNDLGFREGNCCPDNSGTHRPCCSFCVAKPACAEYAMDNSTMCCPARTNRWNPCCGARP